MREPILEPTNGYDLTDAGLPRHCANCRCFLPLANKWQTEEDEGELVAFFTCTKCLHVNKKVVARQ